jgi:hypothetical protein
MAEGESNGQKRKRRKNKLYYYYDYDSVTHKICPSAGLCTRSKIDQQRCRQFRKPISVLKQSSFY